MIFLKDYTLLDELGQGGFATVYKVRHNRLGYVRAIRVLNATIAHGEEDPMYQKFLNECKLLLCLGNGNHPNIVHIYQPFLKENKALVEMDYVDGQSLTGFLESNSGFVESSEVLHLLMDMSSALAYCHEDIYRYCMDRELDNLQDDPDDGSKVLIDEPTRKRLIEKYSVIHNDLHSGNIMRRENGSYVLLDFGLAIEGDEVVRSSRRTNGAPEFKAPEKWENDGIITPQTDIYSFGVVLYEFLTGRVPFPLDKTIGSPERAIFFVGEAHKALLPDPISDVRKEAFEKAYPGSEYKRDYPEWLEKVIMKCLEKNPNKRYANGKELYDEVMEYSRQSEPSPKADEIQFSDHSELIDEIVTLTQENSILAQKNSELTAELARIKNDSRQSDQDDGNVQQDKPKKKKGKLIAAIIISAAVIAGLIWLYIQTKK